MPEGLLSRLYRPNLSLLTDLYELTMAYGYWKNNLSERESVFHLFFRKNPFSGKYAMIAGLEMAIDYLQNLRFEPDDIAYLGGLTGNDGNPLFEPQFLSYLQQLQFSCDVDALPEGSIAFAHEPLLRVTGPLLQAQIVETALLNIINFATLIATKSSRVVEAARGDSILEFGLRRAQGIDGGLSASRAAYIGGCHGTSNVLAGKIFGIPVGGTHAHSWVMCFDTELAAFKAYARAMPNNCIFLVDTYDTLNGIKNAIEVGRILKKKGKQLIGVRLDSGDLVGLSLLARKLLDQAGFASTKIFASNELDEYTIENLKQNGAVITMWGVGTRLSTGHGEGALGGVYKLSAVKDENGQWKDCIKLSEQPLKVSNPGIQQICRIFAQNKPVADIIYDEKEKPNGIGTLNAVEIGSSHFRSFSLKDAKTLLVPIFRKGKLVYEMPSLEKIRHFASDQMKLFGAATLSGYWVGLEEKFNKNKLQLIQQKSLQT